MKAADLKRVEKEKELKKKAQEMKKLRKDKKF